MGVKTWSASLREPKFHVTESEMLGKVFRSEKDEVS
jgi:hypothetical protein